MKTDRASKAATATQTTDPLGELLQRAHVTPALPARAEGIALGELVAVQDNGALLVRIPAFGIEVPAAASLVPATADKVGQRVALGFEGADPMRPIVLGFLLDTAQPGVVADGERVLIEAEREIELRCGDAAILLTADGHITLRGSYVTSHASATQRIRGGSVQIN